MGYLTYLISTTFPIYLSYLCAYRSSSSSSFLLSTIYSLLYSSFLERKKGKAERNKEEEDDSDMDVQSDSDGAPAAAPQKGKKKKVEVESDSDDDSDDESDAGKGSRFGGSVTGSQRGDYRWVACCAVLYCALLCCALLYSTLLYSSSAIISIIRARCM